MKVNLSGKNILITGGTGGLGTSICTELAKCGANVAFTYYSNKSKAENLSKTLINQYAVKSLFYGTSSFNQESTSKMVKDILLHWDQIDVLINNAGVSEFLPLALMEEEDWDNTIDTNLKGTYITARAVAQHMVRKRKGNIINIGSLAGARILAAPIDYCASKAGVIGFTQSLAKEIGRYNIQVNCLAPGILEDGVASGIPQNRLEKFLHQTSLHRIGSFLEVAKFICFMASDRNSYMNGHTIIMDGGL